MVGLPTTQNRFGLSLRGKGQGNGYTGCWAFRSCPGVCMIYECVRVECGVMEGNVIHDKTISKGSPLASTVQWNRAYGRVDPYGHLYFQPKSSSLAPDPHKINIIDSDQLPLRQFHMPRLGREIMQQRTFSRAFLASRTSPASVEMTTATRRLRDRYC